MTGTVLVQVSKSNTIPIPTTPVWQNLWVYPYLWSTLRVYKPHKHHCVGKNSVGLTVASPICFQYFRTQIGSLSIPSLKVGSITDHLPICHSSLITSNSLLICSAGMGHARNAAIFEPHKSGELLLNHAFGFVEIMLEDDWAGSWSFSSSVIVSASPGMFDTTWRGITIVDIVNAWC